ncbi:MAG: hypothetical protein GX648_06045, partial [Crenarchaeota archaeon]|nr:hypothetical protein [Thermoproteota archaeon]
NKDRKKLLSTRRIREWLERLEEIGYIDIREATHENAKGFIDRRYNSYRPLKDVGASDRQETKIDTFTKENAANTAKSKIDVKLMSILEKSFENWLKNAAIENDTQIIILNIDGTAQKITLEDMTKKILNSIFTDKKFTAAFLKTESNTKTENKAESTAIPEIAVNATFSRTLEYEQIKREPGIFCSSEGDGDGCNFEAEFILNGNLFCKTHFMEQARFLQDNGTGLRLKGEAS